MNISLETKKSLKKIGTIVGLAIGFRMVIYLVSVILMAFTIGDKQPLSFGYFLDQWVRWDAQHYIKIAQKGYAGAVENGEHLFLVFFPLYPRVLSLMSSLFGDIRLAGLFISTVMYSIGCVYLYYLVEIDYGKRVARNAVILISVFPYSFFFGGIMTESLFFVLTAAMLYYIRRHKWLVAAVIGIFVTMTRMQGILLAIPALAEIVGTYWYARKNPDSPPFSIGKAIRSLLIFGLMFLGTAYYLLLNFQVEQNPFRFMYYQKTHWYQNLCSPTETLRTIWSYGTSAAAVPKDQAALWFPELILFVFGVCVLALGIKKVRPMYWFYGFFYVLMTFSVTWLLSAGRYLSCGIPLFVILAIVMRKRQKVMWFVTILFTLLLAIYFSGYLGGLQIM